jgi:hypothetical protein
MTFLVEIEQEEDDRWIIGPYLEDATTIDLAGGLADVTGGFRPSKGF